MILEYFSLGTRYLFYGIPGNSHEFKRINRYGLMSSAADGTIFATGNFSFLFSLFPDSPGDSFIHNVIGIQKRGKPVIDFLIIREREPQGFEIASVSLFHMSCFFSHKNYFSLNLCIDSLYYFIEMKLTVDI